MEIIKLSDIIIGIQPELAEIVIKNKLSKEYICWLIIKQLDNKIGDNGGKINKYKLIKKLIEITGSSRFSISRYLKKGENIFWRFDKNNHNILYLNSFQKICIALDLKYVYSDKVIYNLSLFGEHFDKICKSLLIAAVASKKNNPVSNINLAERCNLCKRTIQNHLNNAQNQLNVIYKMENYLCISIHNNFEDAQEAKNKLINDGIYNTNNLKIKLYENNEYWLLKQIPNNILNLTGKLSCKKEKKLINNKFSGKKIKPYKHIYIKPNVEKTGLQYFCSFVEKNGVMSKNIKEIANINIYLERDYE